MKINLGCGRDYRPGWLNVDFFGAADPDLVFDLEKTPWPIEDNCADIILLKHVLEHLGRDSISFLNIISEIYRIAKPDGIIEIHVPHPAHADFLGDPTHVRPITPEMFQCFNLSLVERWQASKLPGTPLAKYIEVDFETTNVESFFDQYWMDILNSGKLTQEDLAHNARSNMNVVQWTRITLRARKPFHHGRSLEHLGAICLERHGGMGDVLMTLGAAKALKEISGKPIYLLTVPQYKDLAESCPYLSGVFTGDDELGILYDRYGDSGGVHRANLNPAAFGIAGKHQIDAYLDYFGLTASPEMKDIVLETDRGEMESESILAGFPAVPAGKKRILLHVAKGDLNRTWDIGNWSALCDKILRQGHQVIAIGNSNDVPGRGAYTLEVPGLLNAVNRLSLFGTLSLMKKSDVLISTDSGPVQLGGATDIHIIGIYSVVLGRSRLPYRKGAVAWNSTAINPECGFSPCYNWLSDADALASSGITDINRIFSDWCISENKYNCMEDDATVDSVLTALFDFIGWG
ncbi:glycosyltransferase family 9 protein [Magnetospirillum sp. 15-1]|uniref:glycosyltransferase family 9 protein n=1 Tax=Magnetospirillum sp. 15-1 TaxID=1979370 RepID=UPI001483B542|nr:glycosyltransferase family 9 protein [Magnetospirillum sp. 15-1]